MGNDTPAIEPVKTGHPTGFWFFFWGEFAERSSYYGMRAILSLYMTERLGIDKSDAGTFMSLFIAACYFLPLLGGYLADNLFGKYWTIVGFSLPYVVGQFIVGIEDNTWCWALALLGDGFRGDQAEHLHLDGNDLRSATTRTGTTAKQCV